MKKALIIALLALISTSSFAAVVKKQDTDESCTLYKVVAGDSLGKVNLKSGEVIIYAKDAYGLSFKDMEINFETREVLVQPVINIVLGANRPLTAEKSSIPADHADFNFLINQLNRKIKVFDQICITDDNKIAYAKTFESSHDKNK